MDSNNKGVITAHRLPSQWLFGAVSPIVLPQRQIADWGQFLPDSEAQSDGLGDTMACLTFSGLHAIEMQVNADIFAKRYPQAALDYFNSAGYMANGKFKCSARYSAKVNGTGKLGNYAAMVMAGFANTSGFGLLPDADWPYDPEMSFNDYYAAIPPQLVAKAKLIYDYVTIQYQELTAQSQVATALSIAPVQVCTTVCAGWDSGSTVSACSGDPEHATVVYGINSDGTYRDFDQYKPFTQNLAANYDFIIMYQCIAQPAIATFTLMKVGSAGSSVSALQQSLKDLGYFPAAQAITQYFGAVTMVAVEAFQKAHGLAVDGVWGINSQTALNNSKKK